MSDQNPPRIVLASGSRYRAALLARLGVAFEAMASDIDEAALPGETPVALCTRLGQQKAAAVASRTGPALVIGSDQVAILDGQQLGKPGTFERALEQLRAMSGREVEFLTSLVVLRVGEQQATVRQHLFVDRTLVRFRRTSEDTLQRYLARETPFDCAGSFKSEAGGIGLVEAMFTSDPNALIGLPLARLAGILEAESVPLFTACDAQSDARSAH